MNSKNQKEELVSALTELLNASMDKDYAMNEEATKAATVRLVAARSYARTLLKNDNVSSLTELEILQNRIERFYEDYASDFCHIQDICKSVGFTDEQVRINNYGESATVKDLAELLYGKILQLQQTGEIAK